MSVMLYACMLCVALCLFVLCVACLTVFVNCLVKQFAMCLGVVAILLLNGIYYRFIVRFPIGLDFLFTTFTFLLHLFLPSTLYSIHFFTPSSSFLITC